MIALNLFIDVDILLCGGEPTEIRAHRIGNCLIPFVLVAERSDRTPYGVEHIVRVVSLESKSSTQPRFCVKRCL